MPLVVSSRVLCFSSSSYRLLVSDRPLHTAHSTQRRGARCVSPFHVLLVRSNVPVHDSPCSPIELLLRGKLSASGRHWLCVYTSSRLVPVCFGPRVGHCAAHAFRMLAVCARCLLGGVGVFRLTLGTPYRECTPISGQCQSSSRFSFLCFYSLLSGTRVC